MTNKQTALAVVEELLDGHDPAAVDRYFAEPYVQHNPLVPDGRTGIRAAITQLPDLHFDVHKVIASGDWVTVASRVTGQGDAPKVIVDTFRFEDGRVAEHWDVTQDEVAGTGTPMLSRSSPGPAHQDAAPLVEKALDELFNQRDLAAIDRYWGDTYLQHAPFLADGVQALRAAMSDLSAEFSYEPGLIMSEGNEVFVHARLSGFGPAPMIVAQIFRLDERGKFAEHWEVVQEEVAAEHSANGNPMTTPRLTV